MGSYMLSYVYWTHLCCLHHWISIFFIYDVSKKDIRTYINYIGYNTYIILYITFAFSSGYWTHLYNFCFYNRTLRQKIGWTAIEVTNPVSECFKATCSITRVSPNPTTNRFGDTKRRGAAIYQTNKQNEIRFCSCFEDASTAVVKEKVGSLQGIPSTSNISLFLIKKKTAKPTVTTHRKPRFR